MTDSIIDELNKKKHIDFSVIQAATDKLFTPLG